MNTITPLLIIASLLIMACQSPSSKILEEVHSFYNTYSDRNNIDALLSHYHEEAILIDMINGDRIEGKEAINKFFDWSNPSFQLSTDKSLKVSDIIINNNKAVISGHFNSFKWSDQHFGPMYFTSILTFNDSYKIIKHVDWINYPSVLLNTDSRKDANTWIIEN